MATERQIQANRRNAAKSTGPRSVEGKAVSRMNALQSGIHAESNIIYGEEESDLNELRDAFYRDHQPETTMECALLDNIIRDTWLLRRFFRIDAEMIDHAIEDALYKKEENQVGKAFIDTSTDQIRLQRRIDATRKSQIQGFKELQRLQAERRANPPTGIRHLASGIGERSEPVTLSPTTPNPQIGFVPQTSLEAPEPPPLVTDLRPLAPISHQRDNVTDASALPGLRLALPPGR